MADNVILPATSQVVATDDIGGVNYQRVKLSLGADGSATDLPIGQQANASSMPVAPSSEWAAQVTETLEVVMQTLLSLNALAERLDVYSNGRGALMVDITGVGLLGVNAPLVSVSGGTLSTLTTLSNLGSLSVDATLVLRNQLSLIAQQQINSICVVS